MSYLTEQAAYLKGLLDGGELDKTTKEGKLLEAMVGLIGDLADELDALGEDVDELAETVDEIDDDLAEVENEVYGDEDDDWDDDDWDDDDEEFAVECPNCGDMIYLDPSLLEGSEQTITCPCCQEQINLEIADDCDCDDCADED